MGDDIVEISTENEPWKNKTGSYDEKRLKASKTKILKQFNDAKRAYLFKSRLEKHIKEQ